MLLSIILPTYNVSIYLEECIYSFLNQEVDKKLYEIIIVNDGSTDDSLIKANQLKSKYSNITVINKKNGGVSSARNLGLASASGDYILFFDPDDVCVEGIFKNIIEFLSNSDVECLLLKQLRTDSKLSLLPLTKSEQYYFSIFDSTVFSGEYLFGKIVLLDFPFRKIIKRSFLEANKILYEVGLSTYEDILFAFMVYSFAKRIAVFSEPLYLYRINSQSATGVASVEKSERDISNLLIVLSRIKNIVDKDSNSYIAYQSLCRRFYQSLLMNKISYSFKYNMLLTLDNFPLSLISCYKEDKVNSVYTSLFKKFQNVMINFICFLPFIFKWVSLKRSI